MADPAPRVTDSHVHKRRLGRNVFVGLVLLAFVALVFAVTMVKLQALV